VEVPKRDRRREREEVPKRDVEVPKRDRRREREEVPRTENHRKHRPTQSRSKTAKTRELTLKEKVGQLQKEKDERRGRREHLATTNPIKYYKEFSKKPKTFRELYASSEEEMSSSSEDSESSDDFPSPNTPKKGYRARQTHKDAMFDKVKDLQKRLYEMEIQNKKLRAMVV